MIGHHQQSQTPYLAIVNYIIMRSMTREELAIRADVDRKTIANQIKQHWDELWALGMRPYNVLPPSIVAWFAKTKFVVRLSATGSTPNPGLYYLRLVKGL